MTSDPKKTIGGYIILKPLLAAVAVLATFGIAEGVARLVRFVRVPPSAAVSPVSYNEPHDDYGYAAPHDSRHRAVKRSPDGSVCYDVSYRIDSFGRRSVGPAPQSPEARHLLLFGGSVTFGEGLDDVDTLQHHLASEMRSRAANDNTVTNYSVANNADTNYTIYNYGIYNYAFHGYGPAHALAKLESGELAAEVPSRRGVALFLLIPWHLSRVTGDTRAPWIYDSPYYYLDASAELQRAGSFRSGRPFTTSIYESLLALRSHSALVTALGIDLPLRVPESAVDLTGVILVDAARRYREAFEGDFWVVFHPSWNLYHADQERQRTQLVAILDEAGVKSLDHAADSMDPEDVVDPDCDLHPSGHFNKRYANQLIEDLAPHLE